MADPYFNYHENERRDHDDYNRDYAALGFWTSIRSYVLLAHPAYSP